MMKPYFGFWALLLSFSVLHGFFLVLVLLRSKALQYSNRILVLLILLLSFLMFDYILHISDLFLQYPHLLYLVSPLWYLLPPLYYVYVRYLCNGKKLSLGDLVHSLPFFFSLYVLVPFYALDSTLKLSYYTPVSETKFETISGWMLLHFFQFVLYLSLSFRLSRKHQDRGANFNSPEKTRWLFLISKIFLLYVLIFVCILFLLYHKNNYFIEMDFLNILVLSSFVHLVAYKMMRQENTNFFWATLNKTKYKNYILKKERLEFYKSQLLDFMNSDKPYKDNTFKMSDLVEKLGVSKHHISQLINSEFQVSFSEFINKYRVQEAKRLLEDPNFKHLTILSIAHEAGFNSQASFYRVFKKHEGLNPGEYLKKIRI